MKTSISYPYPKTIENEKVQSSTVNLQFILSFESLYYQSLRLEEI